MKKIGKRIVSIVCLISLMISTWTIPVLAEESEQTERELLFAEQTERINEDVNDIIEDDDSDKTDSRVEDVKLPAEEKEESLEEVTENMESNRDANSEESIPEESSESLDIKELAEEIQKVISEYTKIGLNNFEGIETLRDRIHKIMEAIELLTSDEQMKIVKSINYIQTIATVIEDLHNALFNEKPSEETESELNDGENSWRYLNGESISEIQAIINDEIQLLSGREAETSVSFEDQNSNDYSEEETKEDLDKGIFAYEVGNGNTYWGIDVSHHQGNIDWQKVKNAGIDFAIIRCGYGKNVTSQDDTQWENNASSCEALGIPYGVYLYSYAQNEEGIDSEVQHTLRLLQNHRPSLPVYIDIEENKQFALGATRLSNFAESFCRQISNAGYKSGLYASRSYWNSHFGAFAALPSYYHWVAEYNSACNYSGRYETWQYSSSGRVDGISGKVDLDYWYGEFDNISGGSTCNCTESYAGNYRCTSNTTLLIRSGHGTSYSSLGSIPSGETVYVSKADGTWAHVEYNGISGYSSMQYLEKICRAPRWGLYDRVCCKSEPLPGHRRFELSCTRRGQRLNLPDL